jgi:hypothetical protein
VSRAGLQDAELLLLLFDKAWDGGALQRRLLEERGIDLIAPKKKSSRRKQDGRKLRLQASLEGRTPFRLAQAHASPVDSWERKAENFLGLVHVGCMVLLLRKLCPRTGS